MSVFKCKMCGADLNVIKGQTIVECEYCGSKQTVPNGDNEKKVNLFNRANRLRIACEFDKAAGIYENIISEFPEDAEAYWGLCLCNYGIEYVDDPVTANKIPTCHRASFKKLRKDENYELALEYAEMDARIIYEDQAKEIDRIMGEILALSKDEEPYDIFICYKESDNVGARTPDSVLAQDIYDNLTQKGYRVFFSRITLEDKLGVHYEPYIFSALNSAKMMLVVGTDYEYMNAVWVRNEWSRYLRLMAEDKSKVLIPCYQNMDPYDMPDQFSGLQSQDCSKLGFMQDLVRGIDKIFGRTNQVNIQKEYVTANGNDASPNIAPLLKRVFIFLEDGNWKDADTYCEKVLDQDPECAEAYLGKLMVELSVKSKDDLKNCAEPFDSKDNCIKALKFSTEIADKLKADNEFIRDRNETARKQKIYDDASSKMEIASTESDFESVAVLFGTIPDFRNANELKDGCLEKAQAEKIKEERINEQRNTTTEAIKQAFDKKIHQKTESELQTKIDELSELLITFESKKANLDAYENECKKTKDEIDALQKERSSLGLFSGIRRKEIDKKLAELIDKAQKYESKIEKQKSEFKGYTSKSTIEAEISSVNKQLEANKSRIKASIDFDIPELTFEQAVDALKDPKIKKIFKNKYYDNLPFEIKFHIAYIC